MRDTRFPSVGLPPYPGIPSLYWRMPPVPQGQSSGGRGSGSAEQGCLRAGSASISRLLQPVIHGYESFRGVETGHRPFHCLCEQGVGGLEGRIGLPAFAASTLSL